MKKVQPLKLVQRHNTSLHILEIKDSSLKIVEQNIYKRTIEEILFQDILIKDMYEVKHHNRFALGYVFFFVTIFVHFIVEPALNPKSTWVPSIISGALAFLSIVHYFINTIKICIPTKNQGMIKLYKNRPSKKKVQGFIYLLEGKANLAAKKMPIKENLNRFLMS